MMSDHPGLGVGNGVSPGWSVTTTVVNFMYREERLAPPLIDLKSHLPPPPPPPTPQTFIISGFQSPVTDRNPGFRAKY